MSDPAAAARITRRSSGDRPASGRLRFLSLAGPLLLVLLWYLVTLLDLAPPLLVPAPGAAFSRLVAMVSGGDVIPDVLASIWRWGAGYAIGCVVGVPIGLAIGRSRPLYFASFPVLDFLRSLPVTALFPLFLLLFGIGDGSKIGMAFAATVFVVILNSAYGVLNAAPTRVYAARVFGASSAQIFRWVIFFEALPQTLVGMRTTLSLSLIVVIVSEMFIGTRVGLGQRVFEAYTVNNTVELYALLLLTGFLGYLMNRVFISAERRIVFWKTQ